MEQQEEKKRKVHRRRKRTPSKSTASLPPELYPEILSKLPQKSVVRFRCVSKIWSSITKEPYFINSFDTQSSTRPRLLFCFQTKGKISVFSIPQPRNSNESYTSQPIDRYQMAYRELNSSFSPTQSVQGLICFYQLGNLIVWNPTTRQLLPLGQPIKRWTTKRIIFLGYDPIEGKHKVVCLPGTRNTASYECQILTLGSAQEPWRIIKTNVKHRCGSRSHTYVQCINGVLYYLAYLIDLSSSGIMSFDVRSEEFRMITLPSDVEASMLTTYEGRLACVEISLALENEITLWILKDAEKHKWSSKHFLAPFAHRDGRTDYKLNGITLAGEFVYATSTYDKPFYVYYFSPETSIFRKIELDGITSDEFRDGCSSYALHTFPNHIERLMSL